MMEVENIDFMFPWLATKLRSMNQLVDNIKNCRAVRALRQAKEFIQSHPFVCLFLGLSIVICCFPFFIFLSFVGGSLVVTLFAALTVLEGVLIVAFALFLTVLLPILTIGGSAVVFIYSPYCLVMKILRIVKEFGKKMTSCASRLRESFSFDDCQEKLQFPNGYEPDFAPANEEMFGEEYAYNMNAEQHFYSHDRSEYLYTQNAEGPVYNEYGEGHLCTPHREVYSYIMNGEDYLYNHYGEEDYWYNRDGPLHY